MFIKTCFSKIGSKDILKEALLSIVKSICLTYLGYTVSYFAISPLFASAFMLTDSKKAQQGFLVLSVGAFVVYWIAQLILLHRRADKATVTRPETHLEWLVRRGTYELLFLMIAIVMCIFLGRPSYPPQNGGATNTFAGTLMFTVVLKNLWLGGALHIIFVFLVFALLCRSFVKKHLNNK